MLLLPINPEIAMWFVEAIKRINDHPSNFKLRLNSLKKLFLRNLPSMATELSSVEGFEGPLTDRKFPTSSPAFLSSLLFFVPL